MVALELAESGTIWTLSQRRSTQAHASSSGSSPPSPRVWISCTLSWELCESGFEGPTAGMVVDECGVDAERMADPERLKVRFEGVTDENGSGAALGAVIMERCCIWTSASVVVAMVREASVMPDHLDGGWCACVERKGKTLPGEVA